MEVKRDRQTDAGSCGRTDGQTDGQAAEDRQMDGRTDGKTKTPAFAHFMKSRNFADFTQSRFIKCAAEFGNWEKPEALSTLGTNHRPFNE